MAIAVFTSFLQLTDNDGALLSGGTVTVYDANTTTPRACFTDTGLSSGATNPIPINTAGRHTQGIIYISATAYKVVLKTSSGAIVPGGTYDNIDPGVPLGAGTLAIANGGTGAATAPAALAALGGATAAELADVSADVAALSGTLASTEKTHIATGTTAQRSASPIEGDIRRNSTTHRYEGYNNSAAFEQFLTDTEIASTAEALAGSDNTKVMTPAKVRAATAFQSALLQVQNQQTQNTAGSSLASGAFRTRVLTTVVTNEITGASLGTNTISLPAGTYWLDANLVCHPTGGTSVLTQARLRNTTDSTTLVTSVSGQMIIESDGVSNLNRGNDFLPLRGRFTLSGTKVLELQQQCNGNFTEGTAANIGTEIYADVCIWKVA